ncbi:DUF6924 domain-containing protein [Streptomyces sp. PsTaAH-124]|uniref:DUF6924 domain-containing protein n=1 Tax=Streptomyces sp. PsTaAH-124 TaxID=1157638 RepID=UPI0003811CD7|nr:hypothetical protein [Streptomyces sp. PsTaAH-124]
MTRSLPDTRRRGELVPVVFRTDYADDRVWQEVRTALDEPDDFGEKESWLVDDPAWHGATVDDVLTAVLADEHLGEDLSVVFVADAVTMGSPLRALLAVTTLTRADCEDEAEYAALTEHGRVFRTEPQGVHPISVNLELANMDFEDFSASAAVAPERVFRADWRAAL